MPAPTVALAVSDGSLTPSEFCADTRYVHVVPGSSPACLWSVKPAWTIEAYVQLLPPSCDPSIRYQVSALLPVSAGACHANSITESSVALAVAVRSVGGPGGAPAVVTETLDVLPFPEAFCAVIR